MIKYALGSIEGNFTSYFIIYKYSTTHIYRSGIEIRMLYHFGGDTIKVGFIGPGKAGVSLGRYFTHRGIELVGFLGRNYKNTMEAAKATNSKAYEDLEELIKESEIIFITTPDDVISIIDEKLSNFNLKNKSICHISGACSSTILNNAKKSGALIYSIHPIFAFSSKNTLIEDLEKIYFSIEGSYLSKKDIDSQQYISQLSIIKFMHLIGNKFFIRDKEDSASYHLANVFVSNLTLSLIKVGSEYLVSLGINEKEAIAALMPLILGNIKSISEKGFINSLTGPVVRGDKGTIEKHLSVLKECHKDIYKDLSLNILDLVAEKEKSDVSELCNNYSNYKETLEILRRM